MRPAARRRRFFYTWSKAMTEPSKQPDDWRGAVIADALLQLRARWGWFVGLGVVLLVLGVLAVGHVFVATLASVIFIGSLMVDRKSTRLNSSHVKISYAVFGWRKKDEE